MSDKVLVIISSSDPDKALTGVLYATNTLKNGWLEDVRLMIFGPAEQLALTNSALQQALQAYMELDANILACKFVADKASASEGLMDLGLNVDYVGAPIGDLIKKGYTPMVW
jgi:hypothetical protein